MNNQKEITETSNNKQSIELVSIFKGFAIVAIILCHFFQLFEINNNFYLFTQFFQSGCQIFFLLSCFTLCLSYEKIKPNYFSFIKKRISKIAIGYWIVIVIYYIIAFISTRFFNINIIGSNIETKNIIINILFLNGLTMSYANNLVVFGGWFVGAIVLIYLLFPALFKIYTIKNKTWEKIRLFLFPIVITVICYLIITVGSIKNETYFSNYFCFLNHLPCFCLGFILYDLHKNNSFKKIKLSFLFSILFLVLSYASFIHFKRIITMPTLAGLGFMFLYISLAHTKSKLSIPSFMRVFKKFIMYFGNQNYYIYLTHTFVVYAINTRIHNFLNVYINNIFLKIIIMLPITFFFIIFIAYLFGLIVKLVNYLLKKIKLIFKNKTIKA